MEAGTRVGNTKAAAITDKASSAEVDSNAATLTLVAMVTAALAVWARTIGEVVSKAVMVRKLLVASNRIKTWVWEWEVWAVSTTA